MADLRALLEQAGHASVRTYIASGNVLLETRSRSRAKVAAELEALVAEAFGVETTAILRTPDELAAVVAGHPFGHDTSQTHVSFLAAEPDARGRPRAWPAPTTAPTGPRSPAPTSTSTIPHGRAGLAPERRQARAAAPGAGHRPQLAYRREARRARPLTGLHRGRRGVGSPHFDREVHHGTRTCRRRSRASAPSAWPDEPGDGAGRAARGRPGDRAPDAARPRAETRARDPLLRHRGGLSPGRRGARRDARRRHAGPARRGDEVRGRGADDRRVHRTTKTPSRLRLRPPNQPT